jgi:hypothetical protein
MTIDPRSGRFVFKSEPEINYYRRVRKCGACGVTFETAEVPERLLGELDALRERLRDARREGSAAIAHAAASEDSLRKLRKALDEEE